MAEWAAFPYAGDYNFDVASVKKNWDRLHRGDLEPMPTQTDLLQAWAHYHNGEFQKAATLGLSLGEAGLNAANKAVCVYATYLEKHETRRLALFQEVAKRTAQQLEKNPDNINARYLQAFALAGYSRGISVAKALAQGLGAKIKTDLESVIRQQPLHLDAHVALGSFHAEVIDKVGSLIGAMAYGVNKDIGLNLFNQAVKLNMQSAFCLVEYANAMLMLGGETMMKEAGRLFQQAARAKPVDAAERLEVEMAKSELKD